MIYQTLEQIAEPIIEGHHNDLRLYDRKILSEMVPGDKAFWTCRSYGTHMVLISQTGALAYFDAICDAFNSEEWFLLEKTGERVTPMTAEKAREHLVLGR